MWHDHSFSQRNKILKITVEVKIGGEEVRVGGDGGEGVGQNFKEVG